MFIQVFLSLSRAYCLVDMHNSINLSHYRLSILCEDSSKFLKGNKKERENRIIYYYRKITRMPALGQPWICFQGGVAEYVNSIKIVSWILKLRFIVFHFKLPFNSSIHWKGNHFIHQTTMLVKFCTNFLI